MNFQKNTLGIAVFTALVSPQFSVAEQQIQEVVTVASRVETPLRRVASSTSVLTAEDIKNRGHATLVDVLRSLPSISVTSNGGLGKTTSLRIRGEAGFRTLVLIDGVDVSDPTGTQAGPQIQHILAADIERVEVLRGPQGMVYGADAGGVINVITRRSNDNINANVNIEQGRYGTTRTTGNIGGKVGTFDYSLSIADLESDGFSVRDIDPTGDRDGYDNTTINAKVGLTVSDRTRFELVVRDTDTQSEFDGFSAGSDQNRVAETEQTNYKLTGHFKATDWSHRFSYGSTETKRDSLASGVSSFSTRGTIDQLQYLGTIDIGGAQLVIGSDWDKEDIVSNSDLALDKTQLGVHAEWQGNVGDDFFYTAGLRSDDVTVDSDSIESLEDVGRHNSVRLTAAYLVQAGRDELKIKASYGNGFRAPALAEIAYNAGPFAFGDAASTVLTEEQSQGFDVGVEYLAANGVTAELVYFDQDIEDEIFFDLAAFSGYLQNTGLTRSKGFELSASAPVFDNVALTGNYTYTDSVDRNGDPRRRAPKNLYNLGVTSQWFDQALNISANMRWVRDVTDGAVQLDDYQVLDITASYQVTDKLNLYIRAENALDEEYQEIDTYNTARASFFGGVRYHF